MPCQYLQTSKPKSNQQEPQSYETINQRLAKLEATVRDKTANDPGLVMGDEGGLRQSTVFRLPSHSPESSQTSGETPRNRAQTISSVSHILRDMSLGGLGGYVGATSQITMGRIISSMMQIEDHSMNDRPIEAASDEGNNQWEHLSPKSASTTTGTSQAAIDLAQIPVAVADKLLRGYIHHISTRWPALHSSFLRQLHQRRAALTDIFE